MSTPSFIEVPAGEVINDAVGYKFRCETPIDAMRIKSIMGWHVCLWIQSQAMLSGNPGEPTRFIPDQDVTVYVKSDAPSLEAFRWAMACRPMDLHVAYESMKPIAQYDGERDQEFPSLDKCSYDDIKKIADSLKKQVDALDDFHVDLFHLNDLLNDHMFSLRHRRSGNQ